MLKYSTYRSIYEKAPEVSAAEHLSARYITPLKEMIIRLLEALMNLFRQDYIVKFMLVMVLVISGSTVVGNVFAGSVSSMKQEKRVVVERGDTLWSIALENKPSKMKTTVYIEGIKRSSGLKNSNIQAGDVISLPIY